MLILLTGWWNHDRETTEESVARARAVCNQSFAFYSSLLSFLFFFLTSPHPLSFLSKNVSQVHKKLQELSVQYAGQKMTLWMVAHGDFISTLLCVLLRRSVVGDHKALYPFFCSFLSFFLS